MKVLCVTFLLAVLASGSNGQEGVALVHFGVACSEVEMEITVSRRGVNEVSLGNWNIGKNCRPEITKKEFKFKLNLLPEPGCGVTRMRRINQEKPLYYHHLFITTTDKQKHEMKVECPGTKGKSSYNRIVKRNVLPADWKEPDFIEITKFVSEKAPIPELSVKVKQNGEEIGDSVTVSPGAPLSMEVSLDRNSTEVYGILVSHLVVTDTSEKNETIIYNGCALDRYIFENFETSNGDMLTANFRAFKFPGSSYLLFKGSVDVCIDKCQAIRCSNGEDGYGKRRRRDVYNKKDPNKVFEASMSALIRVEDGDNEAEEVFNLIKRMRESKAGWRERSSSHPIHQDEEVSFAIFETSGEHSLKVSSAVLSTALLITFLRFI